MHHCLSRDVYCSLVYSSNLTAHRGLGGQAAAMDQNWPTACFCMASAMRMVLVHFKHHLKNKEEEEMEQRPQTTKPKILALCRISWLACEL